MDLRQLKHIMKEFEASSIQKLEIIENDFTVKMEKPGPNNIAVNNNTIGQTPVAENSGQAVESNPEEINNNVLVKAPLVGVFYDSPSPESDPFVTLNQTVKKGDVICIIEAMKVMNEITAPVSGTIKKIHVDNASMVEFGQIVMEIEE